VGGGRQAGWFQLPVKKKNFEKRETRNYGSKGGVEEHSTFFELKNRWGGVNPRKEKKTR